MGGDGLILDLIGNGFVQVAKSLKGQRFLSDIEVEQAVSDFFQQQKKEFYQRGILNLVEVWKDCLNDQGDFA